MPGWIEPLAKWGAILASVILGFYYLVRKARLEGRTAERLKQAKAGDKAQESQYATLEKHRNTDLADDLKRLERLRRRRRRNG